MSNTGEKHTHFPVFIESAGKQVLVIGGGRVAERRVQTLSRFGFQITLIADALTESLREMAGAGVFHCVPGRCCAEEAAAGAPGAEGQEREAGPPEINGQGSSASCFHWIGRFPADMILACTDDRALNRQIGEFARRQGIPVNVCDAREESTFWFPAIAVNEELTMGLVGSGNSHETVRRAAAVLRQIIEDKAY